LIQNSPHAFGDVFISFTEHDRGRNHRAITLNHEVWLMLLGTNVDFWSDAHIHKIIGDHGQVIAWEEDHNNLARVLVKARVVNLEDIPWFIVSTEGPGFEGDSWTIQTETIQSRMLGINAADEDVPPGPDDCNQNSLISLVLGSHIWSMFLSMNQMSKTWMCNRMLRGLGVFGLNSQQTKMSSKV
jgi:hypothetical protein